MRTFSLPLAALLLLPACLDPLLWAEVEIPSAVVVVKNQPFDPTGGSGIPCIDDPSIVRVPNTTCTQESVNQDLGNDFRDLVKDAVALELRMTGLNIASVDAAFPGFGPLARARVLALTAPPQDPPVGPPEIGQELARYERVGPYDPANSKSSVDIPLHSGLNLGDLLKDGHLYLRTELEIDNPPGLPAFNADITGSFYIRVRVDWGKQAGITK